MTAEPADPDTPRMRADARRNRDQILASAERIFAERGTEVPMEEIARAAGVGVGTLYRRFPDRDSLIRAVAVTSFRRVSDSARAAADEESDAWQALTRLLHETTDLRLTMQLAMLSPRAKELLRGDEELREIRQGVADILDELVRQAQADGRVRQDVASGDVALVLSLLLREISGVSTEVSEIAPNRYLTLILDGLQAQPGTPLPGRPVTSADLFMLRRR